MDRLITVSHAIDIVRAVQGCATCTKKTRSTDYVPCPESCITMQTVYALSDADADAVFAAVAARLY